MANKLVPYIQDVNKWTKHYASSARQQTQSEEMMKDIKSYTIRPTVVSEHVQLMAQAKSDLKREKMDAYESYAPIKAEPEFSKPQTPPKKKAKHMKSSKTKPSKKKKSQPTNKQKGRVSCAPDIFE